MRMIKKVLSVLLAAAICASIMQIGMISSFAEAMFDYGDYKFAVKSDNTLAVAQYYGDKVDLELPDHVNDRKVTGVYARCFENSNVETVKLPSLYTTVSAFAFVNCQSLKSIVIPIELVSIGTMAFSSCKSLEEVDFSGAENLAAIEYGAFSGCDSLKSVVLPDTVTSLGDNVFTNCKELKSARLPSSLSELPEYTFYGCESLDSVNLPLSLKSIGESCFENDVKLSKVFIPDSVTTIGNNAFAPMTDNESLTVSCFTGSYAAENFEGYAALNAFDKIIGDFTLDGKLNISDATAIQKYRAGLKDEPVYQALALADVNGDGSVTVRDATLIQMRLADIITEF